MKLPAADRRAEISLQLPRQNQDWSFSLTGSLGSVQIEATLAEGAEEKLADAINANQIKLVYPQNLTRKLEISL